MLRRLVSVGACLLAACAPVPPEKSVEASRPSANAEDLEDGASELVLWEWPDPTGDEQELNFKQLAVIFKSSGGSIQVANGVTVKTSDWPATLVAETSRGPCTASIVGPRTILTAAHCVDRGGEPARAGGGSVSLSRNGQSIPYPIKACTIHPDYASAHMRIKLPRNSADFAFCELVNEIPSSVLTFETISTAPAPAVGDDVLLSGWGCTKLSYNPATGIQGVQPTGSRSKLTMGDESLQATAAGEQIDPAGGYVMTSSSDGLEPSLCPGDSGGPLIAGATLTNQKASRRIVAVNSAVGARLDGGKLAAFESFYAPLSSEQFRTFLESYAPQSVPGASPNRIICGWTQEAGLGGCRE